jgi:hypothetical protein
MKKRILAKTSLFCSKNLILIHIIVFLFAPLLFLPDCSPYMIASLLKIDVDDSKSTNVNNGYTINNSTSTITGSNEGAAQTAEE